MNPFQDYFYTLFDTGLSSVRDSEILLASFMGEQTDFIRLNHSRVRQAGSVQQLELSLELICQKRRATNLCTLSGELQQDQRRIGTLLRQLRDQCTALPEDPYLYFNTQACHSESQETNRLPCSEAVLEQVTRQAHDLDLVGLYTSGEIQRGFANSLGQRNWHSEASFNFDWSCYQHGDKAVKSSYAERQWDAAQFKAKLAAMRAELALLTRTPKTLAPGAYRVYLTPRAVEELLGPVLWSSFGARSHRTRQSALLKLLDGQKTLDSRVHIHEHHAQGLTPTFTDTGFLKPDQVPLVRAGQSAGMLVDARSAGEYDLPVNANQESPQSLAFEPGQLKQEDILQQLGTGLYINQLWYSNFSDPNNCQVTGMTRNACFWVENGAVAAPVHAMRFDESLYRVLGSRLLDLSDTAEWILDSNTYTRRSLSSLRLPGALVDDFRFTL